jgi:hypothetical protein
MTQPDVAIGFEVTGEVAVEYGAYRLRVAEWAEKSPADVTPDDVGRYEIACDEEGRQP